jgi:ATP-dependent protease ClpP protease subunit
MKRMFRAKTPKSMFSATKNEDELQIILYGVIGDDYFGYGIGAKDVADQLAAAGEISRVVLRINSPGGDVFEGAAIYNLLNSSGHQVDVIIDGLAASAASYVAMVGKTVTMGEGAMMMIHNPWCMEIGDANDMRAMANTLDKVRDSMLSGYMKRYTGTQDELKALLDAETWLTAQDCEDCGLCDQISSADDETQARARAASASFDLSIFKHAPKSLTKKAAAAGQCQCPCSECGDGNCVSCSHEGCDCTGCDCDQSVDAKAAKQRKSIFRQRLALYERSVA